MFMTRVRGRIAAAAAAVLVAGTVPAVAAAGQTSGAGTVLSAPAPRQESGTQKYCVRGKATGSNLTRTVCKTRAEWIEQDDFDPLDAAHR